MPATRLREIIARIKADHAIGRLNETTPIEAFEEIASEIEALQADISALRGEITNGGNPRH